MKRVLSSCVVLGAIIALTVIISGPALACSCAGKPTAQKLLKQSAAIFTGVVQKVRPRPGEKSMTTFGILEAFKGPPAGSQMQVLHPSGSSASCGVSFIPGRTYTISVYRGPGGEGFATSLCSTWMFSSKAGHSARLVSDMRKLRRQP